MSSNNTVKKIVNNYLIILIPLILYGFYKNAILVYINYDNNIFYIIKPLILLIGTILISQVLNKYYIKNQFTILISLIIAMITPVNINLYIYFIILVISLMLIKYLKNINIIIIAKLILALTLVFTNYTYLNDFELNNIVEYNILDKIFGNASGGIFSTFNIFLPIIFMYLTFKSIYKWKIPLIILSSYIGISICLLPFLELYEIINNFFNSQILFISIIIATIPIYSPIKTKNIIIYSLSIGILSSLIGNFILVFESAFIITLVVGIIFNIIEKRRVK